MKQLVFSLLIIFSIVPVHGSNYTVPANSHTFYGNTIYPIGWSRDGNFAYVLQYEIGGPCGFCPQYRFVVQSMRTDKVLITKEYEAFSEKYKNKVQPIQAFWNVNKKFIFQSLEQHGIIQKNNITINKGTLFYKGERYSASIDVTTGTFDYQAFEAPLTKETFIASADIWIDAPQLGKKKIYSYKRKKYGSIKKFEVRGFVISPYEQRAALLVMAHGLDSDGGKSVHGVFVGAHLTSGYKKAAETPGGITFKYQPQYLEENHPLNFLIAQWLDPDKKGKKIPQSIYFSYKNNKNYVVFKFDARSGKKDIYHAADSVVLQGKKLVVTSGNKKMIFQQKKPGTLTVSGYINVTYKSGAM